MEKANIKEYVVLQANRDSTIAQKREYGFSQAVERGFKEIILSDVDDLYSGKRIEVLSSRLGRKKFVINDLLVEAGGREHRVLDENRTPTYISFESLMRANLAGFGNSAIEPGILHDVFPIPQDIIAVDWWMATVSSILHGDIEFINQPLTRYRQHSRNIIGMGKGTSKERIKTGLRVKEAHYRGLEGNRKLPKAYRSVFKDLKRETEELEEKLTDPEKMERYVQEVNEYLKGRIPLWWEDVVPLHYLGARL
ncbi:MAG: hypothetical protein JRJ03_03150 [Deltaproteobacteria bacterium]|nr:hypothetical protein [Deltaproteobacteria bacterium]